jgi:hypothetical protein
LVTTSDVLNYLLVLQGRMRRPKVHDYMKELHLWTSRKQCQLTETLQKTM